MDLGLTERIAVVTGASRGIGRATAEALAAEGCEVVIGSRGATELERAAGEISAATGVPVHPVPVDLIDPGSIRRFAERVGSLVPRVDVVVHNIGGPPYSGRGELTDESWQDAFERLFMSARRTAEAFLPGMLDRGWGRLLCVLSTTVRQPGTMLANAHHAAVASWAKALASDVAARGVLVNAVCPGFVAGERLEGLAADRAREIGSTPRQVLSGWMEGVPIGRPATPREVADLIVFLASERASYVTGRCFDVDGGLIKGVL